MPPATNPPAAASADHHPVHHHHDWDPHAPFARATSFWVQAVPAVVWVHLVPADGT